MAFWATGPALPSAETLPRQNPHARADRECVECHAGYQRLFEQPMSTRAREKAFVRETFGRFDPDFFRINCRGCHVESCLDCHVRNGSAVSRPEDGQCLNCHKGYHVGSEYYGMAPREDALRYQRGQVVKGETFLTLLPDVHAQGSLGCADCHSMKSLAAGKKSSKTCTDCHRPDGGVLEHGIGAHMDKLECYACHSAWAAQEYGTFYLRMVDSPAKEYFRVRERGTAHYVKSAYLKEQGAPPLGLNDSGKVSPIRPQFIAYFSNIRNSRPVGEENLLLAARWKAFFPHTVRRGTVMCDGCHNNARRFILEKEEDRVYRLQDSSMRLESFWDQRGQTVANGSFMTPERFAGMASRKPLYRRVYVKKWKNLLQAVENSSGP